VTTRRVLAAVLGILGTTAIVLWGVLILIIGDYDFDAREWLALIVFFAPFGAVIGLMLDELRS
jgi:predicted membrane protein